jgi:hypothetical protein
MTTTMKTLFLSIFTVLATLFVGVYAYNSLRTPADAATRTPSPVEQATVTPTVQATPDQSVTLTDGYTHKDYTGTLQMPCRQAGHESESACTVVPVLLDSTKPVGDIEMDLAVKPNLTSSQSYSIVYLVKASTAPSNAATSVSIATAKDATKMIQADVSTSTDRPFWITSKDGGKTFGNLETTNMEGGDVLTVPAQ